MLNIINNLPANVIGVEVTGEVTKDEYDAKIVPQVDNMVKNQGEINYLVVLKTDLGSFKTGVWWDDFKMMIKHFTKWNKVAIVTDHEGVEKFTDIFSFALPGESRGFKLAEYDQAVKWISS